ncbi:MAG: hypothetical protein ACI92I_000702 [Acidimicrobiales bacterium]
MIGPYNNTKPQIEPSSFQDNAVNKNFIVLKYYSMCFSAPVSFVTSAILATTGVSVMKKKPLRSEMLIAFIPFLFSLQQAVEGVQWILIKQGEPNLILGYLFLLIAFIIWPVYIPFAVYKIENNIKYKNILRFFILAGIAVATWLLFFMLANPLDIYVYDRSIFYSFPYFPYLVELYAVVIAGSLLLTSHKYIRWFGYAITISFLVSYFFYAMTLTSTWCFFAAILSFILYFHFAKKS